MNFIIVHRSIRSRKPSGHIEEVKVALEWNIAELAGPAVVTGAFESAGDPSFRDLVFTIAVPARIRLASSPFALVAVKTVDARTSHFQAALNAISAIFAVANNRL